MDKALREVHEARIRALVAGDLDALDRYVADDLSYTSPHGTLMTKREVFDSFRSGAMKMQSMEVSDLHTRQYGDTAILTYRAVTKFSDLGKIVDGVIQSTTVYLRRDGQWKLVAAHQTSIADGV